MPLQTHVVPAVAQHIPQPGGWVPAVAWSVPAVAHLMPPGVEQASVVDLHCHRALQLGQAFRALQDQALSFQAALNIVLGLLQYQVH